MKAAVIIVICWVGSALSGSIAATMPEYRSAAFSMLLINLSVIIMYKGEQGFQKNK